MWNEIKFQTGEGFSGAELAFSGQSSWYVGKLESGRHWEVTNADSTMSPFSLPSCPEALTEKQHGIGPLWSIRYLFKGFFKKIGYSFMFLNLDLVGQC